MLKVYSSLVGVPSSMCGRIPLQIMLPIPQVAIIAKKMFAHVQDPMLYSPHPLFKVITTVTPAMVVKVTPQMVNSFLNPSGMDRVRNVSLGLLAAVGQDSRGLRRPCHSLLLMTLSFDGAAVKKLGVKLLLQNWLRFFFVLPNAYTISQHP